MANRRSRRIVRAVISFVVFALVWEALGRFVLTGPFAFAPLSTVAAEMWHQFASGAIYPHLLTSGYELGLGFAIAAVFGISMGVLIGVSEGLADFALPLIYAANATPTVALAPLFILLLGVGPASKVVIIFLLCYFAILVNTVAGIRTVDRHLVEAARAFRANRLQIVRLVMLPFAIPFIVAGLRTALGRGLVGVIVAELYGASAGLGWLAWSASEQMNAKLLFVAVTILAVTGVTCTVALDVLERKIAPWRHPPLEAD